MKIHCSHLTMLKQETRLEKKSEQLYLNPIICKHMCVDATNGLYSYLMINSYDYHQYDVYNYNDYHGYFINVRSLL